MVIEKEKERIRKRKEYEEQQRQQEEQERQKNEQKDDQENDLQNLRRKQFKKFMAQKQAEKRGEEVKKEEIRVKERHDKINEQAREQAKLEKEQKAIEMYQKLGAQKFLLYISKNYTSYTNERIEIDSNDVQEHNLRKTLLKTCKYFHSDKSAMGNFTDHQTIIREQIIRILINFINDQKK